MKRRMIAICLVLGLFALLSLPFIQRASAQTSTATPTASATASTGPDLIITSISWMRTNPGMFPATFSFSATIKNVGNVASPAGVIHDVHIDLAGVGSGTVVSTSYTQSILPGASVTVPGDTTWSTSILHNYNVSGTVDSGKRITEMNENNNGFTSPNQIILEATPVPTTPAPTKTSTSTPTNGANLPDLTVLSITEYSYTPPNPTPDAQGCWYPSIRQFGLRVTIQNVGTVDAGAFQLYLNGVQTAVSGLAASQTLLVDFQVPLIRTRVATVDYTGLITESDETNNTLTVTLTTATSTPTGTRPPQVCSTRTPTPTATITSTPTGSSQPDLSFPFNASWVWDPGAYDSANGCYNYTPVLVWSVQVKNTGGANAAGFAVSQNYDRQQAVTGLSVGQTSTLYFPFPGGPGATAAPGQPTLSAGYSNFIADYNNTVSESNESNNTTRSAIPTFTRTVTPQGGATRVYCKATPTPGTPTPSKTPTLTPVVTITRTPTVTLTRTPTVTLTVPAGGTCSPVSSTITAPFAFDGTGTFCWQSSNLGTYINSWNTTSVTINGVNISNVYIAAGSYPAKIGGFWYVTYNSAVAWGHFEAK